MLFYIFSAITINFHDYIDGLQNVQYNFNSDRQEMEIKVLKKDISLYFQKSKDIEISLIKDLNRKPIQTNGYNIPVNSTLNIFAKWETHNDYIIGFFDNENCDYVYYSKSTKSVFPLFLYRGKNLCIYHLQKNSKIKIGGMNFSKIARLIANSEFAEISSSSFTSNRNNENIFIKRNRNILNYDDDDDNIPGFANQNNFTYALGYIFLFAGAFLYILVGCVLGSDCCDCCKCKCCPECDLYKYFDNRDNAFYTKTLEQFQEVLV
ncbi:hypothetical protein M9Y10_006592 [Tritrichomonas musculus]|uniref:Uncharacterized protein n=1 Tax=Tritrichomonas musculus TaxID=1915356 RepID=A0ABR2JEK3_9EUKA